MPFDPQASYGKSLFFGEILEDQLFPYPDIEPSTRETVSSVVEAIDRFMAGVDTRALDRAGELPPTLIAQLKEMGLFGLLVPEEFGGLGLDNTGYARVIQQIAGFDGSIAVTVGAHSSIGFKGLLLFGTPEQKKKYLPKLGTGEIIAAFCLTEPGSGSDAFRYEQSGSLSAVFQFPLGDTFKAARAARRRRPRPSPRSSRTRRSACGTCRGTGTTGARRANTRCWRRRASPRS